MGYLPQARSPINEGAPYRTGITNLMVYALIGQNQNPATERASQLPQPQMIGGNFFYSFTEPTGVSGITYSDTARIPARPCKQTVGRRSRILVPAPTHLQHADDRQSQALPPFE